MYQFYTICGIASKPTYNTICYKALKSDLVVMQTMAYLQLFSCTKVRNVTVNKYIYKFAQMYKKAAANGHIDVAYTILTLYTRWCSWYSPMSDRRGHLLDRLELALSSTYIAAVLPGRAILILLYVMWGRPIMHLRGAHDQSNSHHNRKESETARR